MTEDAPLSATAPLNSVTPRETLLLGRYRIVDGGTEGGFGTVLTCWDTRLQRRVAIKRIPLQRPDLPAGGASVMREALAEARTSSLLAHPNIVAVFDFEADSAFAYLVMEYVDGLTLTELLSRVEGGTLTPAECAYLVSCVAKALAYAHENGVLHLDLKPSNIMVDHAGTVKLCDFGMATLASAAGWGGARGGTVGYMSPEQITGEVVDERADIFSLAVVCWQALTGQCPFAAPSAEASLQLIERGPRTALHTLVPQAQGMAEEAIMAALEPNRAQRLGSVDAFASETCFGLGDPEEGAASLRELLEQAAEGEDAVRASGAALPFSFRHPRLGPTLLRLSCAALVAAASWPALEVLCAQDAQNPQVAAAVCAALALASALWPPLSGLAGLGPTVAALFASTTTASGSLLPLGALAALLLWWLWAGRRSGAAGIAVLGSCLLQQPLAAPAVCALALPPLPAAVTAAGAWGFCALWAAARTAGFAVGEAGPLVWSALATRATLIGAAGAFAAALLGALVTRGWRSVGGSIAGQVVCLAALAAAHVAAAQVEKGGILNGAEMAGVAIALLLGILSCIAAALRGPLCADEEAGPFDELS